MFSLNRIEEHPSHSRLRRPRRSCPLSDCKVCHRGHQAPALSQRNREAQFSGSAVKEEKGFWASLFSSSISSRVERIGENGEREVSSYLADLECEEYQVFNDLLLRNGNYTTQIDHIILSRYGVFVIETKNVHGKVYGSGNAEFWKQYLPDWGYKR